MTLPQPETSHNRSAWAIPLIFAGVFLLTAAILFLALPRLGQVFAFKYGLTFADGYELIADNLVHGNGYRMQANTSETMMREPGYPLFLAGAFKIGGFGISTVRWANLLLAIGIAFLMIRLAHLVTGDRTTSVVAALLFLLYPSTLIAESRGGVEILFIAVVLLFMLLLHRAVDKGNLWHYFAAGLMLGVVVQVRSTPMVFPIFLLGYLLVFASNAMERLKAVLNITVLVTGMVIIITPWMVRNFRLVQHIVPTATVQGVALQEGQYTCQHLTLDENYYVVQNRAGRIRAAMATAFGAPFEGTYYYQVFYDAHDEWAFNKLLSQGVVNEYLSRPQLLAACACKNFFNLWFLGKSWTATLINVLVQAPLLVLAIAGIELLRRRGQLAPMGIVLTFVICIVAVHLPTVAHARHSVPLVPFLAIPASVSLLSLWQKYKTNSPRQPA
jgi:4-amino-4-deoxy-L-arabinose transferase-like glycosyltransferase